MVEYCLGKVLERRVKEAHNIDCLSTNGTRLQLGIGGILYTGANGINIGMNTTTYKSANTVLTVSGATTGSAQPLVKKTQTGAWDGNLALQFKGYANIGGDGSTTGLRINGEDTGNTIFQQGNNNLGITVNNASINSNTNGGNRMIITGTGRTYINPPLNVAGGAPFAVLMVLWQMEV
jgi:hypothetical protein